MTGNIEEREFAMNKNVKTDILNDLLCYRIIQQMTKAALSCIGNGREFFS